VGSKYTKNKNKKQGVSFLFFYFGFNEFGFLN